MFHHGVSTRIHRPNTQWPRSLGRSTCCVQEARVSMMAVKGFLALIEHCPRFFWQQKFVQKMRTKHNQRMSILWCIYYIHKNVLNIVTSNIPCFLYWHPWFVPSFGLQMLVFPVVPLRLGGRSVPPFSWGWRCKRRWRRKRIAKAAGHRLP